jgi:hypothetical protein
MAEIVPKTVRTIFQIGEASSAIAGRLLPHRRNHFSDRRNDLSNRRNDLSTSRNGFSNRWNDFRNCWKDFRNRLWMSGKGNVLGRIVLSVPSYGLRVTSSGFKVVRRGVSGSLSEPGLHGLDGLHGFLLFPTLRSPLDFSTFMNPFNPLNLSNPGSDNGSLRHPLPAAHRRLPLRG